MMKEKKDRERKAEEKAFIRTAELKKFRCANAVVQRLCKQR